MRDVLGGRPRVGPEVSRRIRGWARELGPFSELASVSVQELRCGEPGCPDLETVVLISLGPRRTIKHTIRKPAAKVTREDLAAVLQRREAP